MTSTPNILPNPPPPPPEASTWDVDCSHTLEQSIIALVTRPIVVVVIDPPELPRKFMSWQQRRKLNTHVLRKIFAQVSKTRRIPDRSGKDRRWMSVSQSQASYWCPQIFRVKRSTFKSLWNYCQRKYRSFGSLLLKWIRCTWNNLLAKANVLMLKTRIMVMESRKDEPCLCRFRMPMDWTIPRNDSHYTRLKIYAMY